MVRVFFLNKLILSLFCPASCRFLEQVAIFLVVSARSTFQFVPRKFHDCHASDATAAEITSFASSLSLVNLTETFLRRRASEKSSKNYFCCARVEIHTKSLAVNSTRLHPTLFSFQSANVQLMETSQQKYFAEPATN